MELNYFLPQKYVLKSRTDDFIKMFLPTILVAFILYFYDISRIEAFMFFVFYFVDAGHIYSSFLEIFFDKKQFRTKRMLLISGIALGLNIIMAFLLPNHFFVYLFYFTIFHNLRQGLGVFLIYFQGSEQERSLQKYMFYFCTITPVLLFHFKGVYLGDDKSYTLRPIDLTVWFNKETLFHFFNYGRYLYLLIYTYVVFYLISKKQTGIFSFLFFTLIYSISFLVLDNVMWGMILLVMSHGIPYYFLYNRRIELSHASSFVRKYSFAFVFAFFVIGSLFELTQEDVSVFFPYNIGNIVFAIIFYPVTVHYVYDSFVWKSGDERYELFKKSIKKVS